MAIRIISEDIDQLADLANILSHIYTYQKYYYDKSIYVVTGVEKTKHRDTGEWYLTICYKKENTEYRYSRCINQFLSKYMEFKDA